MKKSSTYLIVVILVGVAAIVANRYYHYLSLRDFVLDVSITCDPAKDSCFTSDCNPSDPGCDTSPYEKVELPASHAPACLEEHSCDSFSCDPKDSACSITFCSKDNLEDGETCTNTGSTTNP